MFTRTLKNCNNKIYLIEISHKAQNSCVYCTVESQKKKFIKIILFYFPIITISLIFCFLQ